MFSYCQNNPVNTSDPTGHWPKWVEKATTWFNNNIVKPVKAFIEKNSKINVTATTSHSANRRPGTGKPGSTYTAPNGDKRTYGSDGYPIQDYDHDDHGRPDKHPHDSDGGHHHDWKDGKRGPAYTINQEHIAGMLMVSGCIIAISYVVINDFTGIGVADDALLGPLGAGVSQGMIMIFS